MCYSKNFIVNSHQYMINNLYIKSINSINKQLEICLLILKLHFKEYIIIVVLISLILFWHLKELIINLKLVLMLL